MRRRASVLVVSLALALAAPAAAEPDLDPLIGARIAPETPVFGEDGRAMTFGDLLSPDGTLLVLGYHRCENICGILQAALAETLMELEDPPRVLFASLDPEERPADARAMREDLQAAVPAADLSGWRFLTGGPGAIDAMSRPMGMQTHVRPGGEVLVHPVAVGVLTPAGALSEVFYGFDFTAAELLRSLSRAAEGYTGGLRERVVLFCSGIDEAVGQVARAAWHGIRLAAVGTLVLVAGGVYRLGRERRR